MLRAALGKIFDKWMPVLLPLARGDLHWMIRRLLARRAFLGYLHRNIGFVRSFVEPGPAEPRELVLKTALQFSEDLELRANPDFYFARGYETVLSILQALERNGFSLRKVGSVLEFGCGSARLLRHFRWIWGIRLCGTDISQEHVNWCRTHMAGMEFHLNGNEPPLRFAADNSFDLVFAYSIFTHIPLRLQDAWMREIRRVLRPGGIFVCTLLGQSYQTLMLNAEERSALSALEREGTLALHSSDPRASFSTQQVSGDYYDVFRTRQNALECFGAVFDVLDYIESGQDMLILKNPERRSFH